MFRYDARGYLSEVSKFESQNSNHFLTPEEKRIEQMCDEERYLGLNKNYDESEMYQGRPNWFKVKPKVTSLVGKRIQTQVFS